MRGALAGLKQFQARYDFEIEVVGRRPPPEARGALGRQGARCLLDGERELCHYYLDHDAVDARLSRMK
jgi:hypothetical protein